jgi:hypothetical protein
MQTKVSCKRPGIGPCANQTTTSTAFPSLNQAQRIWKAPPNLQSRSAASHDGTNVLPELQSNKNTKCDLLLATKHKAIQRIKSHPEMHEHQATKIKSISRTQSHPEMHHRRAIKLTGMSRAVPARDINVCPFCLVRGDEDAGWLSDHLVICRDAVVPCPSKCYGCKKTLPRWAIARHLHDCAAHERPFCPHFWLNDNCP